MSDRKEGIKKLLSRIVDGSVGRLVITHKNRLAAVRRGTGLLRLRGEGVEVAILIQGEDTVFEEVLAGEVPELMAQLANRFYGTRSRKNQELLEAARNAVEEKQSC